MRSGEDKMDGSQVEVMKTKMTETNWKKRRLIDAFEVGFERTGVVIVEDEKKKKVNGCHKQDEAN